ncbi:uncharacterized protein LOC116353622 [Oncorhynchus kisutch]|uniref:uncharacterized protein LOC116353622 n=1 Tax=Oncorhynchus kisutch TaxID=8019 RepID=UPI0012DDBCEB|nr:uncharacterized protein LOC116353622 [Oncorhynchus kisutch]
MYIGSYIDNYEVSNKDTLTGEITVRAACHRSMRKSEKPHSMRVGKDGVKALRTSDSGPKPLLLCCRKCSVQSSGGPSLPDYSQLNIPAAPPVHSCTDTEQHWHKPRTLSVKPGPVGGIEFRKPINSCADGIRSSLYKALNGYMPDMDSLHVSETYANFSPLPAPLGTTMEMSADMPLVESSFGPVQCGSVLSYQLPQPKTHEIVKIADAPSPPILPLDGYRLQASQCAYVLSHQEQFHLKALETTYEMSQS